MNKEIGWLLKEKYFGKPDKKFGKDVKRLEAGEPVDYVIGFTDFLGCRIDLSKKPLIPRPETEYWVGEELKNIKQRKPFDAAQGKILHILDIFSGSGCIGLAILKNIQNSKVDFADKSRNAVEQIEINLKINQPSPKASAWRSKVIKSDVFSNIQGKYDYIFANPPYIPDYRSNPSARLRAILRNRIQKSVLKYEPKDALFGGADGLFYINKFLKQAKNYLTPDGIIFMEFDGSAGSLQVISQKTAIEKLIKKYNYKSFQFNRDQFGRWRWMKIQN